MTHDPSQIEFLLSQRADGVLSAGELAQLAAALQADPALRNLALRYDRLGSLLTRVRAEAVRDDLSAFTNQVCAALRSELEFQLSQTDEARADQPAHIRRALDSQPELQRAGVEMSRLDGLLDRYATQQPAVDMAALASRIRNNIVREAMQARRPSRAWRFVAVGAPLAAAAAIALAIFLNRGPQPDPHQIAKTPTPATPQSSVIVEIASPRSTQTGRVEFTIDAQEPEGWAKANTNIAQTTPEGFVRGKAQPAPDQKSARVTSMKALY